MIESEALKEARRALAARKRADAQYRAAVLEAVADLEAAGVTDVYARVASELGVSRQGVRELVARARRPA